MAIVANTLTLNMAKSLSAVIGLFGLGFAVWMFYATLVLYPSDGDFTLLSAIFYGLLAALGIGSAVLGRLVWRRVSGQSFSTGMIYGLTALIAILWLPLFLVTPSMALYFIISGSLLMLHELFGRQRSKSPATFSESARQTWPLQSHRTQD